MSKTKVFMTETRHKKSSKKVEGKKRRTDQNQLQKKRLWSFKVKRIPAGKITAAAFNTRTVIMADSVTEHQVEQNSTKIAVYLCAVEREITYSNCIANWTFVFVLLIILFWCCRLKKKPTSFACTFSNYYFYISFPQQLSLSNIALQISRSVFINNIAFQVISMVWCHL